MGELAIWIPVFIVSLAILVKSADYFIESAEKIGHALGVNPFIIGVTIVAMGTSLPELVTSLIAVFEKEPGIAVGNAVGSNIANFGLIMAIVAITTRQMDLKFNVLLVEIPFFLGSAILAGIMMIDGKFDLADGIISVFGMIIFLAYTIKGHQEKADECENSKLPATAILIFILSGAAIYFSAKYNVLAVIRISAALNIGTEVIAQTAVALGTSLPELLVSLSAARKKNLEIAVGNLIGSNIFNLFAVLGIPAIVNHFVDNGWNALPVSSDILHFSIPVMLAISFLFFIMMITNKVNRWQGWLLLLIYAYFLISVIRDATAA